MLKFHFLDVGQGDCTIVEMDTLGDRAFGVIDCNRTKQRQSPAVDKLKALGAQKVAFVCLTHPHTDHYSGMLDVFKAFDVSHFITFPFFKSLSDSALRKKFLTDLGILAKNSDDPTYSSRKTELMEILIHAREKLPDDAWFETQGPYSAVILDNFVGPEVWAFCPLPRVKGRFRQWVTEPSIAASWDPNELSVGLSIDYQGVRIVLGADIVGSDWDWVSRIRDSRVKLNAHFSKVPHHGSKKDITNGYMDLVFPGHVANDRFAIISADGISHPDLESMKLIWSRGVKTYCTNLPKFFRASSVQNLIPANGITTRFASMLNTVADPNNEMPQRCRGDITVSIDDKGGISIVSAANPTCQCHSNDLFGGGDQIEPLAI